MNTNSNIYTVVYTSAIVIIVAAVLAFAATSLSKKQRDNEKAEVISQILAAGKFDDQLASAKGNDDILNCYRENIAEAFTIDAAGNRVSVLDAASADVYTVPQLKAQNYNIRDAASLELPVYVFKNGTIVVPIYGAGLWGPVWGYIGLTDDCTTIKGAYFDHSGETPGLGGKIKDDPAFRAQLEGKSLDFGDVKPFAIVKGGAPVGKANAIDAISGATMTSNGVDAAINTWIEAYKAFLTAAPAAGEEPAAEDTEKAVEE